MKILLVRLVRTARGWQRRRIPMISKSRGWEQRLDETRTLWGEDVTELGQYCIRWFEQMSGKSKPRYEAVGRDYVVAMHALQERAERLSDADVFRKRNVPIPPEISETRLLRDRLEPFLKHRMAKKKITSEATVQKYRNYIAEFLALTKIAYIEEVTKEKMDVYLNALEQQKIAVATQANRFALVSTFLRAESEDVSKILRAYILRAPVKTPVSYTDKDLEPLFAYFDSHPEHQKLALVMEFYLKTGLRERELTHLTWDVVDLFHGSLLIQDQRKLKVNRRGGKIEEITFRTKTRRDRNLAIPIEKSLLKKLRLYRDQHPNDRFLFPTRAGNPDPANLKKLHRIIRKAGLNCGKCEACLTPCKNCCNCRCGKCRHCRAEVNYNTHHRRACLNARLGEKPCTRIECQKWNLHRFRHTFATKALRSRKVDLGMLQHLLGHTGLGTTQKYLSVPTGDEAKAAIDSVFAS
jgi:integrase